MGRTQNKKNNKSPWFWTLILVIVGVILLLNNFFLLRDFDVFNLWPLLLVILGAQILLTGDVTFTRRGQTFGITRGSVQSGTIEISAAEVDTNIRALSREARERLIAGQYALQSRPQLNVQDTHAHLRLHRENTYALSLADWDMGLAPDLPWQIYLTAHLGQANLDLSNIIVHQAVIATGIGDIRLISPQEAFENIYVRSSTGNIYIITPPNAQSKITVDKNPALGVHVDANRYMETEANTYLSVDENSEYPPVRIHVSGTFGEVYLA